MCATFWPNAMGVFDFVKHGTSEMRLERGSRAPVFVHPESTLPLWGQLVVEDDDAAVLVSGARALGIVGPGRLSVHASKLHFLVGLAYTGCRLAVQLVFVRLTPIGRMRVAGTLDPIADPGSLGAVTPLVEGELTVQVIDPIAFVEEHLAGGAARPILARRGVIATLDGARLNLEGRRIALFTGDKFRRPTEPRSSRPSGSGLAMACRACGEIGEAGKFCAACGTLVTDQEQCVACRSELRPGARFCESCGIRVTAAPSTRA